MTIDHKTLELAAKAMGLTPLYIEEEDHVRVYDCSSVGWLEGQAFDPRYDHGQILDLAMACKINIDPQINQIKYWVTHFPVTQIKNVDCQDFPALAEAVIQAAAEQQLAKEGVWNG